MSKAFYAALFVLMFATCTPLHAGGWHWLPIHGRANCFARCNHSGNDGRVYQFINGSYVDIGVYSNTNAYGTPRNWKADLVASLNAKAENEQFRAALAESGLAGTPYGAQLGAKYGLYNTRSGYEIQTSQGYGEHVAQVSQYNNIGQVDIERLMQRNADIIERMVSGTGVANAALSDRISQIQEGQAEALKIQVAGQALVESIRAAQPPRTRVERYDAETVPQEYTGQAGQQGAKPIAQIRAEVVLANKCGKCHIDDNKGKFVLQKLDEQTFGRVWEAINTHDPRKQMPPQDSGIAPLTPAEKLTVSRGFHN
jgi:hypothetical protein